MKNKKNKIFKIVLASMMIFSGCFVSVHAEETTTKPLNNTYFDNPLLAVKEDKVIDNNRYNDKGKNENKPKFVKSVDDKGSNLSKDANEGMVWTNKVVEKLSTESEPGQYKITLQARGFKYREVDSSNNKVDNHWKNPLANNTDLIFREKIDDNFHVVDNSFMVIKKIGLKDNIDLLYNKDSYYGLKFNETEIKKEVSFENYDYTSAGNVNQEDYGIAFDVEVQFQVQINTNVDVGVYDTESANSIFTPAHDNFYYYEWGWRKTDSKITGVKWNNNNSKDFTQIQRLYEVSIPDAKGGLFSFAFENEGGKYTGYEIDYKAKGMSDVGIKKIVMKMDLEGSQDTKTFKLIFEITYYDDSSIVLQPKAPVNNNGGNDKELIYDLGEVIEKDDPIERENAGLVNGKKVEEFDNHGYIKLIKNDISTIIDVDKTAVNKNWNERTYDVTITASSKLEKEEKKPIDVVLAIDTSGSMLFPSKLNQVDETVYTLDGLKSYFTENKNIDKEKSYYTIRDPEGTATVYRIYYENRKWHIIDASYSDKSKSKDLSEFSWQNQNHWRIYTASDETDRLEYVKKAAKQFIGSLSNMSSESRLGIVPFNKDVVKNIYNLQTLNSDNASEMKNYISGLTTSGGTNQVSAIKKSTSMLSNSNNEKFIILLTDGSMNAKGLTNENMVEPAEEAKKAGCTLITIGVSLGDIASAKKILSEIASETVSGNKFTYELSYNSEYPAELDSMFNSIISSVMGSSLTEVVVRDYIDPRFDLMNGNVLAKKGDEINGGRVGEDEKGMYIEWTNVTVGNELSGAPGWSKTITLKAKEDFLGGNVITTNGDAYVKVPVDSNGDGKLDANDEWHNVNLPKPTVNVKELTGTTVEKEKTFFLGEDILPEEMINLIKDNIKVDDSIVKILDEILKSGNTTIRYKYPGTGDELGTIKLELTKAFDEKHVAKKVGNHVEEYRLKLTYIPDTYKKRNEDMDNIYVRPIKPSPVCDQFDMVDGTSWVNVIAGQIRVTKHIDQSTSNAGQGDPIFTFRITNTETKESYEKFVRFKDGQTEDLTVVFDNLSKGNWVVEELPTMRYKLDSVVATGDSVSVKDKVAYVNLGRNKENFNKSGFVTFNNELVVEDNLSDTNIVKNTFTVEENGKVTINKISTSENN